MPEEVLGDGTDGELADEGLLGEEGVLDTDGWELLSVNISAGSIFFLFFLSYGYGLSSFSDFSSSSLSSSDDLSSLSLSVILLFDVSLPFIMRRTVSLSIGMLFGIGGTSLISRMLGEGKKDTAKHASSFCFWTSLAIGVFSMVIILVFCEPVCRMIGASDDTIGYATQYLSILSFGIPFLINFLQYK